MELEELKNVWQLVDDRLKKQEILNENRIKEILYAKSDKAVSRLLSFEVLGTILGLLGIPVILYAVSTFRYYPIQVISMYAFVGIVGLAIISQLMKIVTLNRFDPSKTVSSNVRHIERFNVHIKREKIITLIVISVFVLCMIIPAFTHGMATWRWVTVAAIIAIGFILGFFQYKKVYDKNIHSIRKSLEELKELEDETEDERL